MIASSPSTWVALPSIQTVPSPSSMRRNWSVVACVSSPISSPGCSAISTSCMYLPVYRTRRKSVLPSVRSSMSATNPFMASSSIRGVDADQQVVLAGLVPDERRPARVLAEEIGVHLDHALEIAHEVVGRAERERVDREALEDRAGIVEVARIRVVVQHRECPSVVVDVVDAGEPPEPLIIDAGRRIQEVVPGIPQALRVQVHLPADAARQVEAEDLLVAVARARRRAGEAGGATLLAGQAEQADAHGPGREADPTEQRFRGIVVEQPVGAPDARAVDREILLDPVAVDRAERDVNRPEGPVQDHAAVVGDARRAVGVVILEHQAYLAREHQVGNLELAE